jgi:hypothetical protein
MVRIYMRKVGKVIGGKSLSLAVVYTVIQFMTNTLACAKMFFKSIWKNNTA